MPIISIILPVYNAEKYLEKCLDSLKAQTFPDIEILCINDGSTDNSLKICEKHQQQDPRFKIFSQPNSGPAAARNLGLQNAAGTYIMFCDSDDWYQADICEKMYQAIETNKTDMVVCNCHIFDEENNIRPVEELAYYQLNYIGSKEITDDLIIGTNVVLWNKIFRADLIKKYQIRFPDGYEYDDNCFCWQYMSIAHTAFYLPDKLYNYFRRNDSIMGKVYKKTSKSTYDMLYSLEYFYKFLKQNSLLEKYRKLFVNIYCGAKMYNVYLWTESQYQKARKIIKHFCLKLPEDMALSIKNAYPPHYVLCWNDFKLFEFVRNKNIDALTNKRIYDLRITLFNKLVLFNYNIKNSVLRIKLLGLRLLKKKLKKK